MFKGNIYQTQSLLVTKVTKLFPASFTLTWFCLADDENKMILQKISWLRTTIQAAAKIREELCHRFAEIGFAPRSPKEKKQIPHSKLEDFFDFFSGKWEVFGEDRGNKNSCQNMPLIFCWLVGCSPPPLKNLQSILGGNGAMDVCHVGSLVDSEERNGFGEGSGTLRTWTLRPGKWQVEWKGWMARV